MGIVTIIYTLVDSSFVPGPQYVYCCNVSCTVY